MARPRKPTAHLELVGAFKKNPQRTRDSEPVCEEDVLQPPVGLSDDALEAWHFLVDCAVPGVLTKMDSAYLALTARALAATWKGEVDVASMHKVGTMLGKMGMTPSERSRVVVPKPISPGRFAGLVRKV
jgi:hypothetical protein